MVAVAVLAVVTRPLPSPWFLPHYPGRLAGCVNLSGWLPDREQFISVVAQANKSTPMLWAHGSKDDIISFACQAAGAKAMRDAGVPVTTKEYDIGHDSSEAEFADVLQVTGLGGGGGDVGRIECDV